MSERGYLGSFKVPPSFVAELERVAHEAPAELVTRPHCLLCGRAMDSCGGPGDEHWWECYPYDDGEGGGAGCGYSTPRVPTSEERPLTWKVEPEWLQRMRARRAEGNETP